MIISKRKRKQCNFIKINEKRISVSYLYFKISTYSLTMSFILLLMIFIVYDTSYYTFLSHYFKETYISAHLSVTTFLDFSFKISSFSYIESSSCSSFSYNPLILTASSVSSTSMSSAVALAKSLKF